MHCHLPTEIMFARFKLRSKQSYFLKQKVFLWNAGVEFKGVHAFKNELVEVVAYFLSVE